LSIATIEQSLLFIKRRTSISSQYLYSFCGEISIMPTLNWPDEFDRTSPSDRTPYPHNFEVTVREAVENVTDELSRFDAGETRIETAARGLNDPATDVTYNDPGVVAYWRVDGEDFAAPCDQWSTLRDNAQAVYHYLKAKRGMDRWGVQTVGGEFSTARVGKVLATD
jgi:hypothetical protein